MGKPTLNDIQVDKLLTNLAVGYKNEDYIADRVFPIVQVGDVTGIYYKFDKAKFRRVKRDLRAPGAEANIVDYGLTQQTYGPLTEKSLAAKVEKEKIDSAKKNGGVLKPMEKATERVTEAIKIGKEYRLSVWMSNTSNITQNTTLSGTSQWSDYDNSDPVSDVKTAKSTVHANTLKEPNTLILGKEVYDMLLDHPDLIERIKYSREGVTTEEVMARIFGVEQIIVGKAAHNTADEGQTDSLSYLWGKNAWVAYIEERPDVESLSLGYTLQIGNMEVDKWYSIARKSWYVRDSITYEQKAVAAEACYLIKNAVA